MQSKLLLVSLLVMIVLAGCAGGGKYTKRADKYFNDRGQYEFAIENYKEALAKNEPQKGYINFMIAESYRQSNRIALADSFYSAAIAEGYKKEDVQFYYAFALKANAKYDAAKQQLQKYLQTGTRSEWQRRAKAEIANLDNINELLKIQKPFKAENFTELNTDQSDYGPFYFNNELLFSSSRGEGQTYLADGTGFTDLYKFKFDGSSPTSGDVVATNPIFNLPNAHEACPTLSPDGKTMVFARSNTGSKKGTYNQEVYLYVSYYRNGVWSEPIVIPGLNDPESWNSTPCFSADGQSLYFASDREGGEGGIDLYRATMDRNGRWTRVRNLGRTINTPGDELFPYVTSDGRLFFSSDGHPGLGGLDIFVAEKEDGKVTVNNYGQPFNSIADDFSLVFKDPTTGFFSSNRSGGKGNDDIYVFSHREKKPKLVDFVLNGTTNALDPENGEQNALPGTSVKLLDYSGRVLKTVTTGDNSKFSFDLDNSSSYTLVAEKDGYFTKRLNYTTNGKRPAEDSLQEGNNLVPLTIDLVLEKVVKNVVIVLDNIYYDYNKSEIRPDAAVELDKLVEILQDNPGIKIELSSHTDSRGKEDYNQKLSQLRAEAAVEYIISKGINQQRLIAKGYGEAQPRVITSENEFFEIGTELTEAYITGLDDDSLAEQGYQLNRRTEFKVLEIIDVPKTETSAKDVEEKQATPSEEANPAVKEEEEGTGDDDDSEDDD